MPFQTEATEPIEIVAVVLLAAMLCLLLVVVRRRSKQTELARALSSPSIEDVPAPNDPLGRIVHVLRKRPWARRSLSGVSVILALVAVGMLGWPFFTDVYQRRLQSQLDTELASPEIEQAYVAGEVKTGDALTRIKIPKINVDVVVVEGTTQSALRAGAGHYPQTPLPCEAGNVAIAGHRTTYGKPFHNLDQLAPGDEITLETPIGSCRYILEAVPFVVAPTDTHVVDQTDRSMLTLTTCHPKGSARQRLIVQAVLQPEATPA
jgi:sortase A